jgi:hypothetical protein
MLGVLVAAGAIACHAPLQHGPSVPAPVVFSTSCGRFVLSRDGELRRMQPPAPRHRVVSWRNWGSLLTVRRNPAGRIFVLRHRRLAWRSHDLYPRDGGDIAFGPHAFAFASYRRGVFLTDLESPERLVVRGRGLYPTAFDDAGHLIVREAKRIDVISRGGSTLRRYRYRQRNGFTYDERSDTVFFVTPAGRLVRARDLSVRYGRSMTRIDGSITIDPSGLLVFYGPHDVTITSRAGAVLGRASWARSPRVASDSGVSVSADRKAFAFRLTNAHPGSQSGQATVYVLRAGAAKAQAIYRHQLGPSGCAVGANLNWYRRFLLYNSTDGRKAVLDIRSHSAIDLTRIARQLPYRNRGESANISWLSDFVADY